MRGFLLKCLPEGGGTTEQSLISLLFSEQLILGEKGMWTLTGIISRQGVFFHIPVVVQPKISYVVPMT